MKRAVYAGSFDPPTNGHLWMIQASAELFDEVIVAVGDNPEKQSTFSQQERVMMLKTAIFGMDKVRVETFLHTFLVDYAKAISANYILRGVRSAADYEYERIMRYINADLYPTITTVFLIPPREYAEISSTMVKNLIGPKGWEAIVRQYLPKTVYQAILQYYKNRSSVVK
ncbi:MAG: pantetheine-phosphate adenylyltransferase [Neisseriales bacterium]|nr:MAG: pantetheine-phosphate adenylyltransferase [Neisseriales bacterium]